MDSVSVFIRTIIIISFVWCIAETILPDNSMQKHLSFIYGLVVISLTVSVFGKISFNDFFVSSDVEVSAYNKDYIRELYEENLEKILMEKFKSSSVDVELNDEYKIKDIKCDDKKTYDDIMRYLNE